MRDVSIVFYLSLLTACFLSFVNVLFVLTRPVSKNPDVNKYYFYSYSAVFFFGAGINLFHLVLSDSGSKQLFYLFMCGFNIIFYNGSINSEFLRTRYGVKSDGI
jgi:hypothetical protein